MTKPLGVKNYGSIPHFSFSRLGPGDHYCNEGQEEICTVNNKGRRVIVQIKLDGSNVGVARVNGELVPLMRAGYTAISSKREMHHMFHQWVMGNKSRFGFLKEGERIAGEWLAQAHGTRYELWHDPFVAFDIFTQQNNRLTFAQFSEKVRDLFVTPYLIHNSRAPFTMLALSDSLFSYNLIKAHGEIDSVEGAVYRVEDDAKQDVLFLCKFVSHSKVDGLYLDKEVWNWGKE